MESNNAIGDMDEVADVDVQQVDHRAATFQVEDANLASDSVGGRVSESASTVRALPAHILAELERIHHSQQLDVRQEEEQDDDDDEEEEEEGSEGGSVGTALSANPREVPATATITRTNHDHDPQASVHHQQHSSSHPQLAPSNHPPPPPFMMPTSITSSASYSFLSTPSSPRLDGHDSSALPSPPSSPSDSVSSLPSVSSSFFFSSAAASPGLPPRSLSLHSENGNGHDHANGQGHEHEHDGHEHDGGTDERGSAVLSIHQLHRRRRTIRPQRSLESAFSSMESSPSSMELFIGTSGIGRGSSRGRGAVRNRRFSTGQHQYADSAEAAGATSGLIIPSLMLPPALKRPTPYGQTLGEVRLLVLARQGAAPGGRGFLTTLLLEDNDDVVEVGEWEDPVPVSLLAATHPTSDEESEVDLDGLDEELVQLGKAGAKVLRASTDWIEHTDAHGLEKFEPMRNVEVVELPGYDSLTDGDALVSNLKNIVHAPFHAVSDVLHPDSQPSAVLANLVGSASTPLFTALMLLLPSSVTPLDRHIVDSLGAHVPIIVLPASAAKSASASSSYPVSSSSSFSASFPASRDSPVQTQPLGLIQSPSTPERRAATGPLVLSSFRPHDAISLKHGLFHSPETLATLRMEAAGRFLRWREVDRVVRGLNGGGESVARGVSRARERRSMSQRGERKGLGWRGWDKEKWEREWMAEFSRDVAVGMRERTALQKVEDREVIEDLSQSPGVPIEATPLEGEQGGQGEGHDYVGEGLGNDLDEKHAAPRIIAYTHSHSFDPLHFPSLLFFTVSMLGPLKTRVFEVVKNVCRVPLAFVFSDRKKRNSQACPDVTETAVVSEKQGYRQSHTQKWVAVGGLVGVGFCVGVGVGVAARGGAD